MKVKFSKEINNLGKAHDLGFKRGVLEQKKKELKFLLSLRFDEIWDVSYPYVKKRIEKLKKEVKK